MAPSESGQREARKECKQPSKTASRSWRGGRCGQGQRRHWAPTNPANPIPATRACSCQGSGCRVEQRIKAVQAFCCGLKVAPCFLRCRRHWGVGASGIGNKTGSRCGRSWSSSDLALLRNFSLRPPNCCPDCELLTLLACPVVQVLAALHS
jgi:hypothetical protein